MENISGYGYGIWLIPKSQVGSFVVNTYNPYQFKRHITVMCMMSKEMATFAFCNLLTQFNQNDFEFDIASSIINFESSSYDNKIEKEISASKYSAGLNVNVSNWNKILKCLEKFKNKGSIPETTHLTLIYSFDKIDKHKLDYINSKNLIEDNKNYEASLHLVDISHEEPWKWKILK